MKQHPIDKNVRESINHEWADLEFATLQCKDKRRALRFKKVAATLADKPGVSVTQSSESWSDAKAAYRVLDAEEICDESILASHRDATLARLDDSRDDVLLVVQDTVTLNYSNLRCVKGLGPIGNNAEKTTGLFVHGQLVIGARSEEHFGLLRAKIYARESKEFKSGPAGARNRKSIEEKESHRWIEGYREAGELARRFEGQRKVVSVADREGDIYELFAECQEEKERNGQKAADLLVRSQHNRKLSEQDGRLWEHVLKKPVAKRVKVRVAEDRGMGQREATLDVRFAAVELEVPQNKSKYQGYSRRLKLWVVVLKERQAPKGQKAICWKLLTSLEVSDVEQALEVARWYCLRWQIEVMHRVLKSGCRVERRQVRNLKKLKAFIALDLVVACYLLGMSRKARSEPKASVMPWLRREEWEALYCYVHRTTKAPKTPPGIGEAVRWIAKLGGFLGRKGDGEPGAEVLWRGLHSLREITLAYIVFARKKCG
jgi:hypothetical protein